MLCLLLFNPLPMDRTKEFLSLVQLTEIPQNPFSPTNFYTNIYELKKKLEDSIGQISKVTSYESFRIVPLIENCSELLKELKNVYIEEKVSRDYLEVVQNLKSLINTIVLTHQLKLNEIKRKMKAKPNEKQNINTLESEKSQEKSTQNRTVPLQSQDVVIIEQESQHQDQEHLHERKRIMKSITEIGQIVEDISIHVRLQEEQLKRIDDIVITSDKWLKKASNELLDYWDYVRSGRGKIVKYFLMIAFVILIFWIIRKI